MALTFDYRNDYLKVKTDFKDLKEIKDTKHEQEIAVVCKIMQLLNSRTYNDIEEFYEKNNNLQDFIKKHLETPITHFGRNETPLNEEDYTNIIENMRNISKRKQSIETDSIKTTKIDTKEYNAMEIDHKKEFIDNSDSEKTIEERMKDLQDSGEQFQTVDPTKNSENAFKELQSRQEGINAISLKDIDLSSLNQEQKELYLSALNYELSNYAQIRLDLNKGIMIDENDNIMRIVKDEDGIKVLSQENEIIGEETIEQPKKAMQKVLTPNKNTLYSNI